MLLEQPAARRAMLRQRLEAFVLAERQAGRMPGAAGLRDAMGRAR